MILLLLHGLLSLAVGRVAAAALRRFTPGDRLVFAGAAALGIFLGLPVLEGWLSGTWGGAGLWLCWLGIAAVSVLAVREFGWKPGSVLRPLLADIREATWPSRLLWAGVLAWSLGAAVPGWLLPPRAPDAVTYHMLQVQEQFRDPPPPLAFRWDVAEPAGTVPYQARGQTFPNLKFTWPVLLANARGSFAGASAIMLPFLLIWFAVIRALALRLELPGWSAALAAWFVAAMPEVVLQTSDLYADLQAGAAVSLGLWGLVLLRESPASRGAHAALALGAGMMIGAKPSLYLSVALLGLAGLILIFTTAPCSRKLRSAGWLVLLSAGAACVLGGLWPLMAFLDYGNPVYPVAVGPLPGTIPADFNSGFLETQRGWTELEGYYQALLEGGGRTTIAALGSGWGPQVLVLGLPALVLLAVVRPQSGRRVWFLLAAATVVLFIATPDLWWPRFGLQLMTLPALALAWMTARMLTVGRVVPVGLLVTCVAWNAFRLAPAVQGNPLSPALAAYPFITGDTDIVLHRQVPGQFTAREFLRDVVLAETDAWILQDRRIHGLLSTHAPDLTYRGMPLLTLTNTGGDEAEWISYAADPAASFVHVRADTPEAELLRADARFRLLHEDDPPRLEHWWVEPVPREAVFAIVAREEAAP